MGVVGAQFDADTSDTSLALGLAVRHMPPLARMWGVCEVGELPCLTASPHHLPLAQQGFWHRPGTQLKLNE